jgi:hypothetical protein
VAQLALQLKSTQLTGNSNRQLEYAIVVVRVVKRFGNTTTLIGRRARQFTDARFQSTPNTAFRCEIETTLYNLLSSIIGIANSCHIGNQRSGFAIAGQTTRRSLIVIIIIIIKIIQTNTKIEYQYNKQIN